VSKQETNMLSTCLSDYWFSSDGRQSAAYQHLIF